ncbi:MAG: cytochrome c biogenesis protein ResB [Bacteroidales bacterium]|nr:cytochrome c biogenesis protein ResB [Bacteroidales bacterium]
MIQHRKMWQFPWRYKESITLIAGIVIIGFLLQYFLGPFNFSPLGWPINGICGFFILLFALIAGLRQNKFSGWFSGVPMSVSLLAALLVLSIIMGLTLQETHLHPQDPNIFSKLGFRQMTSSWPFVFVYFLLLLSLGTLIVRRLKAFKIKDYPFYLNHIGLWLFLFALGLGAADMKRYTMYVQEGETEHRAYDKEESIHELPVTIRLNDFILEEYPPHLVIMDRKTGDIQPVNKPEQLQLEENPMKGKLGQWNIFIKEYLHQAIRSKDGTYIPTTMQGVFPAVFVEAVHISTGETKEGWVCGGNTLLSFKTLHLDNKLSIVMTPPEPKRFISDIDVIAPNEKSAHTLLEVNKPYRAGNWMIYQTGYDTEAGKLSDYSTMELVYDPWAIPAYAGILLLACGSVCMLWTGNRRKEATHDME